MGKDTREMPGNEGMCTHPVKSILRLKVRMTQRINWSNKETAVIFNNKEALVDKYNLTGIWICQVSIWPHTYAMRSHWNPDIYCYFNQNDPFLWVSSILSSENAKKKKKRCGPRHQTQKGGKKGFNLLMDVFATNLTDWTERLVGVLVDPLFCVHLQTCVSCVFSKKQWIPVKNKQQITRSLPRICEGELIWPLALVKTCDYTFLSVAWCLVSTLSVREKKC